MRARTIRRLALALAALFAVAGCSPDSGALARVGTQTIRKDDFVAVAQLLRARYPGPPDSAKVLLLKDLVDRELLVQGALREGMHQDTTFLDYRRQLEEQLLRQSYYDRIGALGARVSDAEIAELHRWREQESRARLVFTTSENAARAALGQIRAGADFGQVADRFNPRDYTPPGGDIGFVSPGMLQNPLDDAVRTAPLGTLVGPLEAVGQGWFVLRVEERRPRQQQPLEAEHAMLGTVLQQRKQRQILVRALDALRRDYQVRVTPGAGQTLIGRVLPYALQDLNPPVLTPGESGHILVSYDGGVYTLGDAFRDMSSGQTQPPSFNVLPAVERWLEVRALERAAVLEALRRKLDQEPALQRQLRERLNDYLLEGYVGREVLARSAVTPEDLRAAYGRAGISPMRVEQARFQAVMLRDSASAAQLAATVRQVGGLREAVGTAALGVRVVTENVEFPTAHVFWSSLEAPFRMLEPGDYAGPIEVPGGYVIAQLVSKNMVAQTFESLPQETLAELEHHALEYKRSQLLAQLSDSLRRVIPIATWPERLRRVPWPEAPPAFTTPG